jgi:hypothetical protein
MAIPVVQADLVELIGEAEVDKYALAGGDGSVTKRIAEAWGDFRSAGINVWTPASIDELTSASIAPALRYKIAWLAIGNLSSGSNRNDFITEGVAKAEEWLESVRSGKENYDGLVKISGTTGGVTARVGAPDSRVFDRNDSRSGLARRHNFTR